MVMMVEPLRAAIGAARATIAKSEPLADRAPVIYLSPQGEQLNQQVVTELAAMTAMVLLSGDHRLIEQWRLKQALGRTYERRPDLLDARELSENEQTLLREYLAERDS